MKSSISTVLFVLTLFVLSSCNKEYTCTCTATAYGTSVPQSTTIKNVSKAIAEELCNQGDTEDVVAGVETDCELEE